MQPTGIVSGVDIRERSRIWGAGNPINGWAHPQDSGLLSKVGAVDLSVRWKPLSAARKLFDATHCWTLDLRTFAIFLN